MNVFDRIKEKCIYEQGIGRHSFETFLKVLNKVEKEYLEKAKQPVPEHPIPLDTQMYIKELERANTWIKCDSGKMPKEGQYVLVKLSDDIETESEIQIRKYEPSRDKEYPWKELDFGSWLRFDLVIEWKPL